MTHNGIGKYIRLARARLDLTRAQAAKRVGISTTYLGHLERSDAVHLSDPLLEKLVKKIQVSRKGLKRLQAKHNAKVTRIRRTYPSQKRS